MSTRINACLLGCGTALFCSVFAPSARGQCIYPGECSPTCTTGPDAITGKLTGPANYSPVGTIDALSIGTYACNIGNVGVDWMADNNLHPVIGGNFYKYSVVNGAGRFEQIGLSWLKHAFFAESDNLCCNDCQATDGSTLGVHCADPYTAGRNGTRNLLGPRWQVNAHTGVFPYPPANPPWSGSVARRLEVDVTELLPSNGTTVRYFGESHYVTPDDAAAGNQNNNASYREMTATPNATTPADWDFDFAAGSDTQRTLQAIRAWPLADPGAQLVPVQIPDGGLYIVGYHATQIGATNMYHYEYAVYNMNDDSNAGAFSIPVCANISNVGFHGVTYRDGDGPGDVNFDNTPWPALISTVGITWSTDSALNIHANAIRWGTTYNFRFDSSSPPVSGQATVRLWSRPGSFTARVDVPAPLCTSSLVSCAGDGTGAACPCGNAKPGNVAGCLNSLGRGGLLTASGGASVAADSLVLIGSDMPNDTAIYLQGSIGAGATHGRRFGDGLLCLDGATVRLGLHTNHAGRSCFPDPSDPAISLRGGVPIGATRAYQIWYRDPADFCTPANYNLSNAVEITWQP
jgi:hypothetical protein